MALGKIKNKQTVKQAAESPDQFMAKGGSLMDKMIENPRQVAIAVGASLVVILLVIVVYNLLQESKMKVSDRFREAQKTFEARVVENDAEFKKASEGADAKKNPVFKSDEDKYKAALEKFEAFVKEEGKTPYTNLARVYLATCYLNVKQFDKAIEILKGLTSDDKIEPSNAALARKLLGAAYEEQQKWDAALAEYQALAGIKDGFLQDVGVYHAARMLEKQGKNKEALAGYTNLLDNFKDSEYKANAEKRKIYLESLASASADKK